MDTRQDQQIDVFSFAPYRVAGVHYIDVLVATGAAMTEELIVAQDASEKIPLATSDTKLIYRILQRKYIAKAINPDQIRMVIESDKGYPRAVIDQEGVVRMRGEEYQLSPFNFVMLSRTMEDIAEQVARRRGIKRRR